MSHVWLFHVALHSVFHEIMVFVCQALDLHRREGRPLEVANIFQNMGWRLMLVIRSYDQLQFPFFKFVCYILWLGIRACVIIGSHLGLGHRDFAATFDVRNYVLVCEPKLRCVDWRMLLNFQVNSLGQRKTPNKVHVAKLLAHILFLYKRPKGIYCGLYHGLGYGGRI